MHTDSGQIVENFEFDDIKISVMQNQKKEISTLLVLVTNRYRP